MPKVSVVIAAYNAMQYLPQTLESIYNQTFQDFEIIIVDDGSNDNIEQWITDLNNSQIKFFSQPNLGSAAARNHALEHASGDYIAFIDSDDLCTPTKLEKQVNILDSDPKAGLVYTWVAMIDEQGQLVGKVCKNSDEGNVWIKLIEHDIIETGSNPMVRRSCFDKVGVFDRNLPYAQTWEMWLRIASKFKFRVIREPLILYRTHPNNTSKKWQKMESNYQAIIEKVFTGAPPEYQQLKARSYGFAYLRIAWKTLQTLGGECGAAREFRNTALKYCSDLRFSTQCVRLDIAILLVSIFGLDGYSQIRKSFHRFSPARLKFLKATTFRFKLD